MADPGVEAPLRLLDLGQEHPSSLLSDLTDDPMIPSVSFRIPKGEMAR